MADEFTTSTRVKNLVRQTGGGGWDEFNGTAIDNAVKAANAYLIKIGVPSTETDEGVKSPADRLALSYLVEGLIVAHALVGTVQAAGSLRIMAGEMRESAIAEVFPYIPATRQETQVANNRNWAYARGGPLHSGSEAGTYRRAIR